MTAKPKTKKLDFFAWHPADYRADTAHLSREADYAFRRILDEIFITAQDTCQIVDDDQYLRALCRASEREWQNIRHTLIDGPKALLGKRNGHVYSERMETEIRRAQGIVNKRSEASVVRWENERNANASHVNTERKQIKKNPSDSKKEKEIESPTGDPARQALRTRLAEAGLLGSRASTATEKLIARWAESPGAEVVAELLTQNIESVQAADRPLQYLGAIVRNNRTAAPLALVTSIESERVRRLDAIREAAYPLKRSSNPVEQEYIAWLAPDGLIREDPLTFDEWRERQKESA